MYFSGQIDKVYLDIKIANYTEESTGRNRGATGSGKIVIGLYGKAAPESVKRFLATIDGSSTTTLSLWIISVLAVPKSIAISWVKKLNNPIFLFF